MVDFGWVKIQIRSDTKKRTILDVEITYFPRTFSVFVFVQLIQMSEGSSTTIEENIKSPDLFDLTNQLKRNLNEGSFNLKEI